jgi:hypothetical protein
MGVFELKLLLVFEKKWIITFFFRKTQMFPPKNWQKAPNIIIKASIPDQQIHVCHTAFLGVENALDIIVADG